MDLTMLATAHGSCIRARIDRKDGLPCLPGCSFLRPSFHLQRMVRQPGRFPSSLQLAAIVVLPAVLQRIRRRLPRHVWRRAAGPSCTWHACQSSLEDVDPAADEVVQALKALTMLDTWPHFALVGVPRKWHASLRRIVDDIAKTFPSAAVLGVLSGAEHIRVGVAVGSAEENAQQHCFAVECFTVGTDLVRAGKGAASCLPASQDHGNLLVFADAASSAKLVAQVLHAADGNLPNATISGLVAAPPSQTDEAAGSCVYLRKLGQEELSMQGGVIGLWIPATASGRSALDLVACRPLGPALEVFDATHKPKFTIRSIGTDEIDNEQRDMEGAAGTDDEMRTAPTRRKALEIATAVSRQAKKSGLRTLNGLWIGVARKDGDQNVSAANAWALYGIAGATQSGGLVLAGEGPKTEGHTLPISTMLTWVQVFQTVPEENAAQHLFEALKAAAHENTGCPYGTLGFAAGRSLHEPSGVDFFIVGSIVLGKAKGAQHSALHRQAMNVLQLRS